MIWAYTPPSRWWRRRRELRITIWPQWLAERLCSHSGVVVESGVAMTCPDCYKLIWPERENT